jgi:hypothetical protein
MRTVSGLVSIADVRTHQRRPRLAWAKNRCRARPAGGPRAACRAGFASGASGDWRGSGVGQGCAGQVAARGHVEFAEHLAEVIVDGAGADE